MAQSSADRPAETAANRTLDCRGLLCPMPIVKTGHEMKRLQPGEVLKVVTTDRGAIADMPAFAADTGNTLLAWRREGVDLVFYLRKEVASE
jgi:tRNA 2-thiouridine synthesizing protein A